MKILQKGIRTMLQPLNDRVLVRERPRAEVSRGGIFIPESAVKDSKQDIGEVVAVGDGKILETGTVVPLTVAVGQSVLYGRFAGTEVSLDAQAYKILREDEIAGIVHETEVDVEVEVADPVPPAES